MARGKQLQQLVDDLKAEIGWASAVSANTGALPSLQGLLRRVQETLYDEYDWPFLKVIDSKPLAKGQRYYDFPAEVPLENITEVTCWWNGQPSPVLRGIGFGEYAAYDSDADERNDPVQRWDVRWTGSSEQIEVWPIPATDYTAANRYQLYITGKRALRPLVSDSDVADLDGPLIVLFAAAELLARQDSADARAKLTAAQQRFARLKGRTQSAAAPVVLGGRAQPEDGRRRTIIRVSG